MLVTLEQHARTQKINVSDMARIKDDKELRNRHAKEHGFVYNDFGDATGWNPENFNKLHKASCRWVKRMKTSTPKHA